MVGGQREKSKLCTPYFLDHTRATGFKGELYII